ncbi:MAG: hypothetical protein ABIP51_16005 [Bacteroidia bacterium]
MKKIQIKKKTKTVLTKLNEITITQLESCYNILENKEGSQIDKWNEVICELSDISSDEVEEIPFNEQLELIQAINITNMPQDKVKVIEEIKLKDKCFRAKKIINGKEMELITPYIISNPKNYLLYLAAIIYKEIDKDGNLIKDYSEDGIQQRKELFKELKADVIMPFLIIIQKYLVEKANAKGLE